jgi:hypothetical protein
VCPLPGRAGRNKPGKDEVVVAVSEQLMTVFCVYGVSINSSLIILNFFFFRGTFKNWREGIMSRGRIGYDKVKDEWEAESHEEGEKFHFKRVFDEAKAAYDGGSSGMTFEEDPKNKYYVEGQVRYIDFVLNLRHENGHLDPIHFDTRLNNAKTKQVAKKRVSIYTT